MPAPNKWLIKHAGGHSNWEVFRKGEHRQVVDLALKLKR